jgi:hypothetical protein
LKNSRYEVVITPFDGNVSVGGQASAFVSPAFTFDGTRASAVGTALTEVTTGVNEGAFEINPTLMQQIKTQLNTGATSQFEFAGFPVKFNQPLAVTGYFPATGPGRTGEVLTLRLTPTAPGGGDVNTTTFTIVNVAVDGDPNTAGVQAVPVTLATNDMIKFVIQGITSTGGSNFIDVSGTFPNKNKLPNITLIGIVP